MNFLEGCSVAQQPITIDPDQLRVSNLVWWVTTRYVRNFTLNSDLATIIHAALRALQATKVAYTMNNRVTHA